MERWSCDRPATFDAIWRNMTWHEVTWRDMTWDDVTWRDMMWRDMTWTWHDATWRDVTRRDETWRDMTWLDMTWRDTTWRDITWHDVTWRDMTCDPDLNATRIFFFFFQNIFMDSIQQMPQDVLHNELYCMLDDWRYCRKPIKTFLGLKLLTGYS